MNLELLILPLIFFVSLVLLFKNFKYSLYVLIVLSVLLHKELFSIYRWDFLPVRFFMLGVLLYFFVVLFKGIYQEYKEHSFSGVKNRAKYYLNDPFILLLLLLWAVRGISIIFSQNLQASVFLYGFFTTITALGLLVYVRFRNSPSQVRKLIYFFGGVAFITAVLTFVQYFLHWRYDFVVGAFWYIPNNLARVGSTFWDVNHFGGMLALLLPFLGVSILVQDSWKKRILLAFTFSVMALVLVFTNSRTAWIAAGVSFLSFLTLLLIRRFGFRGIIYVISALILISIPFVREYSIKSSPFRAQIKQYFHYRIDSFDSHILLLQGAGEVFTNFPVLGGGYGGFFEHFSETSVAPTYFGRDPAGLNTRVPPHTIWGEALSETGLVGTFIFGSLLLIILIPSLYIALNYEDKRKVFHAGAMFSAIVGILMAGVFYSYNSEFFWLIIFLYFVYSVSMLDGGFRLNRILEWFLHLKWLDGVIVFCLSALVIFWGLGSTHLIPWDEAIYAQISKNMFNSGDYITLQWLREGVWFEKPPFYMWSTSFWYGILGVNEWAVRMTSALAGLGTVLATYFMGRKMFSRKVGFISAIVLLTTFHFLYYARAGMLDVTLTFFSTLALYFYFWGKHKNSSAYWLLSGAFIGLGVLTKGVVGFLPFGIIFFNEATQFGLKINSYTISQSVKSFILAFTTSALVFLPWHLVMYVKYADQFLATYIGYHVLARATGSIEDKGKPWDWYFTVLKVSMRLWFIALIAALPYSIVSVSFPSFRKKLLTREVKSIILLLCWAFVVFVFFSAATSKLIWYIIPVYPALSLIVGYFLAQIIQFIAKRFFERKYYVVQVLSLFAVVLLAFGYLFIEKDLVYTGDLTYKQAELLQKKDELFGLRETVYADSIELPLVLFYSNGPVVNLDYSSLRAKLMSVEYDENVVFITKESRFRELSETYSELDLEDRRDEWVLGVLPSQKQLDLEKLEELQSSLDSLNEELEESPEREAVLDPLIELNEENIKDLKLEISLKSSMPQTLMN